VTGTHTAEAPPLLDAMLELLGSRIVFLIDWNKARKARCRSFRPGHP
jgi:hypothetical protein